MKRPAVLVLTLLFVVATAAGLHAGSDAVRRGQAIVEAKCGRCHATGASGASPHPEAPPFRDIARKYPAEGLAEALAEGIVSGHPDMPVFIFEPYEIDGIVGYLNSLGRPPDR